jgi:hypothetical protein
MSNDFYGAIGLTGGTAGMLDDIQGTFLDNGDCALVLIPSTGKFYYYWLDDDADSAESSPDIIKPDANAGTKRWLLIHSSDTLGVLASAREWTAQQNFNEYNIGVSGATQAWNLDVAQCAYFDLATAGENTTVANPTNMNAGGTYTLRVEGDGSSTLSFGVAYDWGEQSAPSAPSANGDILICSFYSDGSTMYGGKFCLVEA